MEHHVLNIFQIHALVSVRKGKKWEFLVGYKFVNSRQKLCTIMALIERDAWLSFVSVTKNFLGNTKGDNYVHVVNDMLEKVKRLNLHMSIKIHFLFSHLERFPENFEAVKDGKGKDFTKM